MSDTGGFTFVFRSGDKSAVLAAAVPLIKASHVVTASYASYSICSKKRNGVRPDVTLVMDVISKANVFTICKMLGLRMN